MIPKNASNEDQKIQFSQESLKKYFGSFFFCFYFLKILQELAETFIVQELNN